MVLRWRSGTSSAELSCTTISRLGRARPDSRKLTWRCDTPDCRASASWLAPRRRRQARSMGPNRSGCGERLKEGSWGMTGNLAPARRSADYLEHNCWQGGSSNRKATEPEEAPNGQAAIAERPPAALRQAAGAEIHGGQRDVGEGG